MRKANPPPGRQGPRPLPLHLAAQIATLLGSRAALPSLRNGSLAWNPVLRDRAEALRRQLEPVDAEAFDRALAAESARRMDGFLAGIEAYRRHPYRRRLREPPCAWSEGTTRLLDYSLPGAKGPPVLVVPSLINRAYVLDLTARRSLLRALAKAGHRPYLVDWGPPGAEELKFGLDDYIAGRLVRALAWVRKQAGKPALLGYCMGGNLALALGILKPDLVRGLALLATPWDFHAPDDGQARMVAALGGPIEGAIMMFGGLPVDLLQALFAAVDPGGIERKFRAFAEMGGESERRREFVALEDWLNDGVPLAGPVARETLFGWYIENRTARGAWRVAGKPIRPKGFAKPALVIVPGRDRIVPPASAMALAKSLPNAKILTVDTGHIGMVTGSRARTEVYRPLLAWLAWLASARRG